MMLHCESAALGRLGAATANVETLIFFRRGQRAAKTDKIMPCSPWCIIESRTESSSEGFCAGAGAAIATTDLFAPPPLRKGGILLESHAALPFATVQ
jgi:hypothetical protein